MRLDWLGLWRDHYERHTWWMEILWDAGGLKSLSEAHRLLYCTLLIENDWNFWKLCPMGIVSTTTSCSLILNKMHGDGISIFSCGYSAEKLCSIEILYHGGDGIMTIEKRVLRLDSFINTFVLRFFDFGNCATPNHLDITLTITNFHTSTTLYFRVVSVSRTNWNLNLHFWASIHQLGYRRKYIIEFNVQLGTQFWRGNLRRLLNFICSELSASPSKGDVRLLPRSTMLECIQPSLPLLIA